MITESMYQLAKSHVAKCQECRQISLTKVQEVYDNAARPMLEELEDHKAKLENNPTKADFHALANVGLKLEALKRQVDLARQHIQNDCDSATEGAKALIAVYEQQELDARMIAERRRMQERRIRKIPSL